MNETKPAFIINKYRSILFAAIIVEAVGFIVSLTDSVVAGLFLGEETFAAVGLMSPFLSASTFLTSIINTGTVLNFSFQVGKFNKKRANEFFSQGVITALATGAIYALVLLMVSRPLIDGIAPSEEIRQNLSEYFYFFLPFFFLQPIACVLDNLLFADGAEHLSAAANTIMIVSNVVFSVLFANLWGIKGIAIASVLSRVLFIMIISLHFFSRKNTLKFVFHWKKADLFIIFKSGIVKASTYALDAILIYIINQFAAFYFDINTLLILLVVERFMGIMTLFIGLSMGIQPILSTLQGENNTKAQRFLVLAAVRDMIIVGGIITLLTFFLSSQFVIAFGIEEDSVLYSQAVIALRIVSSTVILQAVLTFFFIYYVYIDKKALAFVICLIKNFISPVVIAVLLAVILGSNAGIWIGLASAPILALLISVLIVYLKYGRKQFPFLIKEDPDQEIFIYDFDINEDNVVKLAATVQDRMNQLSFPANTEVMAGLITEEVLMLILDKNEETKKTIRAECTLLSRPDGIMLILRDSGVIFDFTETDVHVDSFRQYIVSTLMMKQELKLYLTTTGYNRNEFFFKRTN